MRPRPSEVIAGIRAILAETIAPELTSEHAKARLTEIRAVLAQIDWDGHGFDLVARTAAMSHALHRARGYVDGDLPAPPAEPTAAGYEEYQRQLAETAIVALAGLRARLAAEPADDEARTIYRALLESL
ncbi:hypothetical protein IU443_12620 [Nocardia farcinica]|uniref:hypothetical protein n=1 Tax=Nocardia farcinica TaxID=37329 RepID=UPI000A364E7B|nr:hypothetical protein [Nocardia farcinica]MBA4857503.1 hypothetical protein [Nocardia farcinica]MBC9816198.1 hypothetical protein [Nocardia farcinica]MBF6072429.1 hypothetical protein [Nocardia farcinica]MBF6262399.1 hypothetical protein [Nocardia farcinica]MBF6280939.1 hypothetical protein [Nocardia farcinica]